MLTHLARHAPHNSRVEYTVGSNLTSNINPQLITKLQIENALYISDQITHVKLIGYSDVKN